MSANPTNVTSNLSVASLTESPFGAEIRGLDARNISDADRALIWQTYRDCHGLICFDFERLLEDDELHSLTAVFGENEYAPGLINGIGKRPAPGEESLTLEEQLEKIHATGRDPYMAYIGNLNPTTLSPRENVNKKFYGEWEWHTDMSYIEVPPTFSLLHSREIPDEGGDTGFCDQVSAAGDLPADLRRRVKGITIKHDSTYGSSGVPRPGMTAPASPIEAIGHPHPVIRHVPTTGDEALFLGRRTNAYVTDMPLAESEALLNELWAHATQEKYNYRHAWKVGQVVAWDNRMMMHMRHPMDETKARFMWRTQTRGEAVIRAV
jgi:taurine dioxygenase